MGVDLVGGGDRDDPGRVAGKGDGGGEAGAGDLAVENRQAASERGPAPRKDAKDKEADKGQEDAGKTDAAGERTGHIGEFQAEAGGASSAAARRGMRVARGSETSAWKLSAGVGGSRVAS